MPKDEIERARREAEDSPVAWFLILERARKTGDFEAASQAAKELKRLGVTVKYGRRSEGVPHD